MEFIYDGMVMIFAYKADPMHLSISQRFALVKERIYTISFFLVPKQIAHQFDGIFIYRESIFLLQFFSQYFS